MRVVLASLLTAVLFFSFMPGARADDAQSLLAKHKAFVGWQFGDGTFTSFDMQRDGVTKKGQTDRAIEHRVGLVYRRNYGAGNATGFTGKIFWGTTRNGFTVPYIGDEAQRMLAIDVLMMEGTTELPAELHGSTTIDGKTVPVVRVTMKGAKPIDLAIDPATGAYLQATVDPDGSPETISIASYTTLPDGKKMIGSWSLDGERYTYTKIIPNPQLVDRNFTPPAPLASWTFGSAAPVPIGVTDERIYLNAKVNGVPGTFVLDTGASGIYLTDEFANRAHVKTIGTARASGIGGDVKTLKRQAKTIDLGNGNVLSNALIYTDNETYREGKFNQEVDGFFGFDFLAGARVSVNLGAKTMTIQPDDEAATAPAGGYVVSVDLSGDVPVVPMELDGKVNVDAIMDTGNAAVGVLASSKIRDHGVVMVSALRAQGGDGLIANQGFLGGNRTIVGIGGETERVYCGSLDKVVIGPFVYQNNGVCLSANQSLHDGLLGFDFLKNFDYIFDYHHGTIVMIPRRNN
ncbi:MAG TPA: aspartyl protease family protein [Candidatus Aquilonibacter sp.]|nr:aspartyl protease family protein [Candidatus Aquilonibacter sp.]